jgi:hypothetical protein
MTKTNTIKTDTITVRVNHRALSHRTNRFETKTRVVHQLSIAFKWYGLFCME